jgi:serine kinase of HPr protein (carbohydrate metabolism regulator)
MNVQELMEKTGWNCIAAAGSLDREVEGAYCGDLLSWVMGNGEPNQAWITVQVHMNVIAVAVLREFSCVIIADNANVPEEVIAKAEEEGLPILESGIPVYASAKKLVELGI